MDKKNDRPVSLPIQWQSSPATDLPLSVLAFDSKNQFVEKVRVENKAASFQKLAQRVESYNFLIVPENEKTALITDYKTLMKARAYAPVLSFDLKGKINLLPIPDSFYDFWLWRFCRVRGKVIKNFFVHGLTEDKPVCHARVHICEVDRIYWIIDIIPDDIIRKIPDLIYKVPFPPIPDPGPFPEPIGPFPDPIGPVVLPDRNIFKARALSAESNVSVAKDFLSIHTPSIQSKLLSGNVQTIKNTIAQNFELFQPYICYYPFLRDYFYSCEELTTVYTDNNGRFDTNIIYFVPGDQPDLYFWVEYLIGGVWTTVYDPGFSCHTYWDYACGTDITIRITDVRVPWVCDDLLSGDVIWIKTIGQSTNFARIWQNNTIGTTAHGHSFNKIGLTDVSLPYSANTFGDYRRPFGGSMSIQVQFSPFLPTANIAYYRWSVRRIKDSNLNSVVNPPIVLNNPLSKGYGYAYIFGAILHLDGYNTYKLGPFNVGTEKDLFRIPPFDVASIAGAGELYPWWHTGQNTFSVSFDSKSLQGDGLYEFKLELFDNAGVKVEVPPSVFQIPDPNTFAPHQNAPSNYIIPGSGGKANAFKFLMRVDNNPAVCDIYQIQTDTDNDGVYVNAASDCCGFVPYNGSNDTDDQIKIRFKAYQLNNFADFFFNVYKGTCGNTLASDSAMVIGNTALYARNVLSIFEHNFTPKELLGSCALQTVSGVVVEGKAAFAETLVVQPLAVNGDDQAYGNVSSVAAFALEPA